MPDSFVAYDEAPKDSFVAYDAGDLGGYKPGASASRKEHARSLPPSWLGPFKPLYNAVDTSLGEGSQQMYQGLQGLASFPGWDESAHNASQVIRGGLTAASPAALPFALGSPATVLPRMAKGLLAQYLVENAGKTFVPDAPGTSELASDIAGLYAAGRTPKEPGPPGGPNGGGAGRYFKGALKPTDIFDVFSPVRLAKNVATRVGKNYMEANIPAPPGEPTPPEYPIFKASRTTKERMPTFVPGAEEQFRGAPGTIIPRKGFTPPPEPPPATPEPYEFKPGKKTKLNMPTFVPGEQSYGQPGKILPRGEFTPPPEAAPEPFEPFKPSPRTAKLVRGRPSDNPYGGTPGKRIVARGGSELVPKPPTEETPTIEGKPIPKEAIEAEIAKRRVEPVTTKDLAPLPANTRETSRSVYKMAYDEFGEGQSKAGLEKVVENLFGKDRTTAYSEKGLKEAIDKGKTPLTTGEWNTLHRHMEKLYKPSVPKPPQ